MKKITAILIIVIFASCGKSLEQRAADAKYLQDIKNATSNIAEEINRVQRERDYKNALGAINAQIRALEAK